jgi:thiol-disulfide isomerase/thioredoxin
MKKIVIIVAVVALVIGFTLYADRATRRPHAANSLSNTSLAASTAIKKPEPQLTLKDLDGKDISLNDLKGKVVFVNFWATWCGPCQDEIPSLIEMQNKYASKGFTVVGIAMDEDGKGVVAPFVAKQLYDVEGQKLHINYPILIGSDEASDKFGGIMGYPTSFLLSRNGTQLVKFQGPPDPEVIAKAVESSE